MLAAGRIELGICAVRIEDFLVPQPSRHVVRQKSARQRGRLQVPSGLECPWRWSKIRDRRSQRRRCCPSCHIAPRRPKCPSNHCRRWRWRPGAVLLMPGSKAAFAVGGAVLGGIGIARPEQHNKRLAGNLEIGDQHLRRRREQIGLLGQIGRAVKRGRALRRWRAKTSASSCRSVGAFGRRAVDIGGGWSRRR